jgi:F-type H+-transporting ATPase subunit epsilon
MNTYQLTIVTPEKMVYDEKVESLIAPGTVGYLGILAHHAPLMTGLVPGKLTIRKADGEVEILAISGGFLEVSNNKATILADAIEWVSDIDLARAKAAVDRAKDKLHTRQGDINQNQEELERALNRVRVYTSEHGAK